MAGSGRATMYLVTPDPAELLLRTSFHFTVLRARSSRERSDAMKMAARRHRPRVAVALERSIRLADERCRDDVMKVAVRARESAAHSERCDPDPAAMPRSPHSLVSAHTILGVENGEFISLLDPPAGFRRPCRAIAETSAPGPCSPAMTPPAMLSSPIILYDYPQIAPESAGNLFDSTEIDEILSLRILTLTDEEKARDAAIGRSRPRNPGTHREHARRAIHETPRRAARPRHWAKEETQ